MKNVRRTVFVTLATLVATPAFAVIDTSIIEAELNAMGGYMTTVGAALIAAAAVAIGFKWLKGAIFG